ncbi:MAG: type II toxin-antitoxin system RelE/ParE family toxin [Luteimonas sp.]
MVILTTETFDAWIAVLKDESGCGKIVARIERMRVGNFGDSKSVGSGVSELRIGGRGPGYRVYYAMQGEEVVILLCAGDKSSQKSDIKQAQEIAAAL